MKYTSLIIILFFTITTNAQKKKEIIANNGFHIALTAQYYNKLQLHNTGADLLQSRHTLSGEFTVSYHKELVNNYGINIGAGLGLAPFNQNYHFKIPTNSIFYTGNYEQGGDYFDLIDYSYANFIWVFPISIDKSFILKKKQFNITLGGKLNLINAYPGIISLESSSIIDTNNLDVTLYKSNLFTTTKHNTLFTYFFKIGYLHKMKKRNLGINLIYNYSKQNIMEGTYHFYNLPYESYGTIENNINYIGIEFKL